ncbi:MAG: hypothetical protein F9K25_17135 [Candidatus Contendobacter sp.]|nr:MAG: hypothetical protein F9K25_17135 [Candidatus Contendobacter sp.]
MSGRTHQVAVQLDSQAFERLKRLALASGQPYAATIGQALERMEGYTSHGLAPASGFRVYAQLPEVERRAWRKKVRQWRAEGESFGGIAKRLFLEFGLTAADGLPLLSSTVRGMAASGPDF